MGAAESTPAAKDAPLDPSFDQKTSGVRITGTTEESVEERIKRAYEKGKQEGLDSFSSSLEQVAAQVYDNVHSQLQTIQTDALVKGKIAVSAQCSVLVCIVC
jgi:hypothetical protein